MRARSTLTSIKSHGKLLIINHKFVLCGNKKCAEETKRQAVGENKIKSSSKPNEFIFQKDGKERIERRRRKKCKEIRKRVERRRRKKKKVIRK